VRVSKDAQPRCKPLDDKAVGLAGDAFRDWREGALWNTLATMPQAKPSALSQIERVDYTVIFVTDMPAMRRFYEEVMGFRLSRTLSERWHEYSLGDTTLVLAVGGRFGDEAPSPHHAALQLAFKVAPDAVARCAQELEAKGITLISQLTDHAFGHRTIFFRDPEANLIEIYAEI
jgi:lactoylglutathione lyase